MGRQIGIGEPRTGVPRKHQALRAARFANKAVFSFSSRSLCFTEISVNRTFIEYIYV